ncbi:MAG: type II secretion system F family protein, partial [Anaerovoracaceae bacterium]
FGYLLIFFLCLLFYRSFLLSFFCGFTIVFWLGPYQNYLSAKRRALLLLQFKDLLYSLSASIATGRQMSTALEEAYENLSLIYPQDSPIIAELKYMVRGISENRDREEALLISFAQRSQIEDIKNFVEVYLACRISGGNLETIIAKASEIIMDKMAIEKEIKSLTAQKRFEGKIITVMPLGVVFCLNLFYPDYLIALYETFAGRIIMTLALVGIGVSYYLMMKLTEIEV